MGYRRLHSTGDKPVGWDLDEMTFKTKIEFQPVGTDGVITHLLAYDVLKEAPVIRYNAATKQGEIYLISLDQGNDE